MATGPNLHCQAQFTVTLTIGLVVRVSAHGRAYITKGRLLFKQGPKMRKCTGWPCLNHHPPSFLFCPFLCHSSSGVNTLSGSLPKSHSSQYSDRGFTRTPLFVDHSPDSGLVSTPVSTHTHIELLFWWRHSCSPSPFTFGAPPSSYLIPLCYPLSFHPFIFQSFLPLWAEPNTVSLFSARSVLPSGHWPLA